MERKETLRAWTLVDELVVEIHHMTSKLPGGGPEDLPAAMRARALRSGLLIVKGVHGAGSDLAPALAGAIGSLSELRYFLYLARRLGMIDLRRYRSACAQHEKVERSLRELIPGSPPAPRAGAPTLGEPLAAPAAPREERGFEGGPRTARHRHSRARPVARSESME